MNSRYITLGLFAHVDAGKTTLSESILHLAGVIDIAGRVDKRDAYLDNNEIERQRGITVFSKQAVFERDGLFFTLLDTPGHADLSAESERTLDVLDCAVLIVSASDGVNARTRFFFNLLAERDIPTFIFVNKMDQAGADRDALMGELNSSFGTGAVDFSKGLSQKTAEIAAGEDEGALEYFLEHGDLEKSDYRRLIAERKIFPVFFGSALKEEGVEKLLQALSEFPQSKTYHRTFGALVYKISRDSKGTRLTHLKITGGSLRVKDLLGAEKVNEIRLYSGENYRNLDEGKAGQVIAVTGPVKTYCGQGFGIEGIGALCADTGEKSPVTYTVVYDDDTDDFAALARMRELDEEIPELSVEWNEESGEIRAGITGTVQMEIIQRIARDRWRWNISFSGRRVEYLETLTEPVIGAGHFEPLRHYAEVHLLVEPAERGRGIILDSACPADVLSENYQKQILSVLAGETLRGVLTDSPLTDVKITLLGGRSHLKHTEGGDFRQAALRALRQALRKGESVLLEPTFEFRIEVPETASGRVMADITKMGGTCEPSEAGGGRFAVTGNVPASEIGGYDVELASFTSGEGNMALREGPYTLCHNSEEVIEKAAYDPDRDISNTGDSVFCSHGAGVNVPWNESDEKMHMRFSLDEIFGKAGGGEDEEISFNYTFREREKQYDPAELERIFSMNQPANRNLKKDRKPAGYKGRKIIKSDSGYRVKSTGINNASSEEILIVDGYNAIFAWNELKELAAEDLGAAREKLLEALANYGTYLGRKVLVIFDAYRRPRGVEISESRPGVTVIYTREDETADQFIERTVLENADKMRITVATSDKLEQMAVFGQGAMRMSSRELIADIESRNREIRAALERIRGMS